MIGEDMKYEAAESRPVILSWLTKGILFFSCIMLLISCLSLFSVYKQINRNKSYVANKPVGDTYEIKAYESIEETIMAAKKLK